MDEPQKSGLLEFLRRNRERALAEWEGAVRRMSPAKRLELTALRDHVPELLDRLIDIVETGGSANGMAPLPDQHAATRIDQGFSVTQIAEEYRVLRSTLFRLLETEPAPLEAGALLVLNEAIDHAVLRALERYHQVRARTLDALERVTQEAFAANEAPLGDFLRRFAGVIVETVPDVDTAIIYLRELDRLVARATLGIESAMPDLSVAMGEGFAGGVAGTRSPRFTATAESEPGVRRDLVEAGIRAVYAVPLIHGDELLGVAKMGSRTATAFSEDDRQLFADMAQRAAIVIAHRRLAEDRDMLLGVLGHDLRSPLNTIALGSGFLKREPLSAAGARTVERIASAAARMDRMIADLADYTHVRFGAGIAVERHVMDLSEMLEHLVPELRAQHASRTIELAADGDLAGEWDRTRLVQVVTNLVNNAVAYSEPSSTITVRAFGTDRDVTLAVHNTGPPIPARLLPQLFEAFKRGKSRTQGTGLGLYIVQHIAAAHGGLVSVESTREGGTTFTVTLPRWSRA